MKSTYFIQLYKNMFRIEVTQAISYILWTTLGNDWKYILNFVSRYVSVILNCNVFCNAYTVQRKSYSGAVEYD